MRIFRQNPSYFPKVLILIILIMILLAIAGGLQLSQLIYRLNESSKQRTDQLMVMEGLDEAAIVLGRQIQEWKDMLLRVDDVKLYSKHKKAFLDSSIGVQEALLRTKITMQKEGMDPGEIDLLRLEHKALVSNYLHAQENLSMHRIESPHEVDREVLGVDRSLQQHISTVKTNVENTVMMQQSKPIPSQSKRYVLVAVIGTCSLLVMAILGFACGTLLQGYSSGETLNNAAV